MNEKKAQNCDDVIRSVGGSAFSHVSRLFIVEEKATWFCFISILFRLRGKGKRFNKQGNVIIMIFSW